MNVDGRPTRAIRRSAKGLAVEAIDQTRLPHAFAWARIATLSDACAAIRTMVVRGAPLIGVTGAYGLALALADDPSDASLASAADALVATRPTAVNLAWAVNRVRGVVTPLPARERAEAAMAEADRMAEEDVATNRAIGDHGFALLKALADGKRGETLHVLTHCNAGWLATVDHGTALAPVYRAFDAGVSIHVFADETRPRGQGARLTAWELSKHGVPVTLVADNAAAHLMQRGEVDVAIVGADRITARGDVVNKVGTLGKALAAAHAHVPFYVAAPLSTVDASIEDGMDVPIEERSPREVTHVEGRLPGGEPAEVLIAPEGVRAWNPAFDVTPARLVAGIVTERGVVPASSDGVRRAIRGRPAAAAPSARRE